MKNNYSSWQSANGRAIKALSSSSSEPKYHQKTQKNLLKK
jgi:hypothetical protein